MSVNLDSALRKANDLNDEQLYAALLLAEGDQRLSSLLQPPLDHLRAEADLPLDEGSRRQAMCPDLYRAMLSGSINRVNELLGLQEEMTRINNVSHGNCTYEPFFYYFFFMKEGGTHQFLLRPYKTVLVEFQVPHQFMTIMQMQ